MFCKKSLFRKLNFHGNLIHSAFNEIKGENDKIRNHFE